MALTDSHETPHPRNAFRASDLGSSSRAALARLPEIHTEAFETGHLARFLRSAVGTAAGLMLMGALAISVAGGAGIKQEFAWSLLVLAGVGAMLRSYIRSTAQAFDRAPLREAAKDLRAILFYSGFAWGAGAFLLLGDNPLPVMGLGFAVLPSIVLALLLRDPEASLSFLLPVTGLTAAAMILEHWAGMPVALTLLLIVQGSIAVGLMLAGRAKPVIPAGLSLR